MSTLALLQANCKAICAESLSFLSFVAVLDNSSFQMTYSIVFFNQKWGGNLSFIFVFSCLYTSIQHKHPQGCTGEGVPNIKRCTVFDRKEFIANQPLIRNEINDLWEFKRAPVFRSRLPSICCTLHCFLLQVQKLSFDLIWFPKLILQPPMGVCLSFLLSITFYLLHTPLFSVARTNTLTL